MGSPPPEPLDDDETVIPAFVPLIRRSIVVVSLLLASSRAAAQSEPVPTLPQDTPPAPPVEVPQPDDAPVEPPPAKPVEEPAPPPPEEEPRRRPARFGARGEIVLTTGIGLGASYTTRENTEARSSSISFAPGIDWFFIRWVSLGIETEATYSVGRGYGAGDSLVETRSTTFSAGPRIGVVIPLGDRVSLYPRVTGGVASTHLVQSVVSGTQSTLGTPLGLPSTTYQGPWVSLYLPVLIHPAPELFIGAGPSLYHLFARANADPDVGGQQTTIGGRFIVGTWWGGEPDLRTPAEPTTRRRPRFGESGQYVFGGSIGSAYSTTYEGTRSTAFALTLTPAFDYFVLDHLALGGAVSFSYSHLESPAPSTQEIIKNDYTAFFLAPRIGVALPLGSFVTLYPVANLSFGTLNHDIKSSKADNKENASIVAVGVYAPLLFHVAEHGFIGFGPYVSHDLSFKEENSNREFNATTVGASVTVGGWL
jgi:hypothetical protein